MSNYKVGDKFEIEIEEVFNSVSAYGTYTNNLLYRIKGFNSLVFDENGLDKLKKIEVNENIKEIKKTAKASELAIDTKVFCWNSDESETISVRYFATLFNGIMYSYANGYTSKENWSLISWKHMTLEDGTVVLPE